MRKITKKQVSIEEIEKTADTVRKQIKHFKPIVSKMLEDFSPEEYVKNVCENLIDQHLDTANKGDILFQCEEIHNRRYFERVNKLHRPPESLEKPGVNVNIVDVVKFTIDCPRAGSYLCRLRHYGKSDSDIEDYSK
jgi:hypothetical protein